MSKVYVVQAQSVWRGGSLVPKYDVSDAERYGELVYVFKKTVPLDPSSVAKLDVTLAKFTADDYLLLIGNPCLIGWATALAARATGGWVKMLQWSGKFQRYLLIEAKIY